MPQEVIADGPNGPLVLRNGQWVPFTQAQAAPPTIVTKRADPKQPYEIAKLQSETDPATLRASRDKAVADAQKARAEADKAVAETTKKNDPAALAGKLFDNDTVLRNIALARTRLNGWTTGTGAYLEYLPATEARSLKGILDTVRGNLTFDRLQQMRNDSPTGGAVGNASDNDMKLLGSTAGSLDQFQKPEDIARVLDDIEHKYLGLRADMVGQPRDKFTASYYAATQPKKDQSVAVPSFTGPGGGAPGAGAPPAGGPDKGVDPRTLAGSAEGYAAPSDNALTTYKDVPNPDKQKAYAALVQFLNTNPSEAQVRNFVGGRPIYPGGLADDIIKYKKATGRYAIAPGSLVDQVPLSAAELSRNLTASQPDNVFYKNLTNDALGGLPRAVATSSMFDPTGARGAAIDAADATHPNYALAGKIGGTATGALVAELGTLRAARAFGLGADTASAWAPRIGDFTYGGVSGATSNPNNPGGGALGGAALGSIGGAVGRGVGGAVARPFRPNAADSEIGTAINAAGPDIVGNTLREGQGLGLPMALADTAPQLGSIAGAAVRRSPNAAQIAGNTLRPRALGQIDRLGTAIERDLGPIGNVPQISEDLQAAGRANAGPLYDAAYPQTVNDPAVSNLLSNPQMGDALRSARMFRDQDATLARAQGQPEPPPLTQPSGPPQPNGIGPQGPVDIRTIDYIKRGLDGRINTAFTGGDPQAAMSGPFLRQARGIMLNAADSAVPDYAAARAAYSGPMRAQEAMELGQGAVHPNVTANQLGVDLAGVEPGNIPQAQLGYRSGMMDKANGARFKSNPFDTALGTPEAVAKLETMYPGNIGNNRLLRQRDLERQMQATNNNVLGGSQTAERSIADQTFKDNDPLGSMIGAGADIASGSPVNTAVNAARLGARRMFGSRADARAVSKADAMTPILLNPNADESLAELARILGGMQRYNRVTGVTRPSGSIAGVGAGLSLPGIYGN